MVVGNSGASGLSNAQMESHSKDTSTPIFAGYTSLGGAAAFQVAPDGTATIGTGAGTAGQLGLTVNYGANSAISAEGAGFPSISTLSTTNTVSTKIQSLTSAGIVGTQSNHDLLIYANNTLRVVVGADGTVTVSVALVLPQSAEASIPNGGIAWSTDAPGTLKARLPDGTLKTVTLT